eukprot:4912100-Pleurochrysis_carterae.AAC.1
MEGSTRGGEVCGVLASLLFVWFLALGGENFPACRPRSATGEQAKGRSRERNGRECGRGLRAQLRGACMDAGA